VRKDEISKVTPMRTIKFILTSLWKYNELLIMVTGRKFKFLTRKDEIRKK